ncbi:unnamed protein product [Meganyctiphanes norvegica]|uniref:Phospholipase A2-like central domain-containing protein n=1 Tax=Meganyctiphanes norvegica TaxID=48144 RepID=A0AAV2PT50_MEGNR
MSSAVCFLVLLCSGICLSRPDGLTDYMVEDNLDDGQHEVRLHWHGVTAKQASVGSQLDAQGGLVYRQVSYKDGIVQLIYNGDPSRKSSNPLVLKDCEFAHDEDEVKNFLVTFIDDVEAAKEYPEDSLAGVMGNVTFTRLSELEDIPEHLQELVKFRHLKAQCKNHHRKIRTEVKEKRKQANKLEENDDSESQGHSRARRSVLDTFTLVPHTKWCGAGYSANVYSDVGAYSGADACCRAHDLRCPYYISSFQKKYGIMNWGVGTVNHCACDERFRACLKMARTGASNVVGQLFFDIVKTRCFVFKKEKVCKKESWWGKCEKYGYARKAVLRDPIPWNNHPSRYT